MQDSARPQPVGDQRHGGRLQQAALVVASLGPGVREKHPHTGQGRRAEHVLQHIDAVPANHADVGDGLGLGGPVDRAEQLRQPFAVDLHRDHVEFGFGLRHRQRGGTGARADLQDQRGRAAEPGLGVEVDDGLRIFVAGLHAQLGPEPVPGLLLGRRQRRASGAEAGHPGKTVRLGGRHVGRLVCRRRPTDVGPGRVHPSIVSYLRRGARIVVEIDTQQLPQAAGT